MEVGADVNACNSFGYSCMLEACHRGYIVVAKTLLKGKVDLAYIPSEELSANSPFASAPCQSALAEAARSGFFKVVQVEHHTPSLPSLQYQHISYTMLIILIFLLFYKCFCRPYLMLVRQRICRIVWDGPPCTKPASITASRL